ncbi:MAG: LemA family protein [Nitrospirae bacterium]|nr:LemA family protein [Nitrospirota bacterium]
MRRKITRYMLYSAALIIALMFVMSKVVYNKMIDEEHFMLISRGRLEAELQKREDLNRNAIEAVNVYVETEEELLHRLITLAGEVKTGANAARIMANRGEIERLVSTMDILVMMSPRLKSRGPYLFLMETFSSTENGVLAARLNYNTAACEYDMFLDKFPYSVVAWVYGFKRARIFTASERAGKAPEVDRQGM